MDASPKSEVDLEHWGARAGHSQTPLSRRVKIGVLVGALAITILVAAITIGAIWPAKAEDFEPWSMWMNPGFTVAGAQLEGLRRVYLMLESVAVLVATGVVWLMVIASVLLIKSFKQEKKVNIANK
jgi:hypothetical protein